MTSDYLDLPASADEAVQRAARWFSTDPYPDVPPALLNSRDIVDYVAATGMLHPFYDTTDKLKTASYEVDLLGTCIYFDPSGEKHTQELGRGEEFVLRANSIAFVTLEPYFRLPQYVALRFNLRITHVYRGLLLGTGPLVDPGFSGRLSIPLHNLTTNEYILRGGEGLIWVEFTKVSPDVRLRAPGVAAPLIPRTKRQGAIASLPAEKKDKNVLWYLRRAEPSRPIQSGIPQATADASKAAESATDVAKSFRRRLDLATVFGVVALVALVISTYALITDVQTRIDEVSGSIDDESSQIQEDAIDELQVRLDELEAALENEVPVVSETPTPVDGSP